MNNPKGWLELGLMYHPKPKDRGLELVGGRGKLCEVYQEKYNLLCRFKSGTSSLTGVIQSLPLADKGEGEIFANGNFLYKMKIYPLFLAPFLCLLISLAFSLK